MNNNIRVNDMSKTQLRATVNRLERQRRAAWREYYRALDRLAQSNHAYNTLLEKYRQLEAQVHPIDDEDVPLSQIVERMKKEEAP